MAFPIWEDNKPEAGIQSMPVLLVAATSSHYDRMNTSANSIFLDVMSAAKGDYENCQPNSECPSHCEFVRRSGSGCVHCRCEGRELVPAYQECPPSKIDGPVAGDQKVCRPANREGKVQTGHLRARMYVYTLLHNLHHKYLV